MLRTLTIKNFALIEHLEVGFGPGLSVITGETGAGKSIIIGALGLILGERADAGSVRKGADKAVVEGHFSLSGNKKIDSLLREHQLDVAEELILRREVSARGQGRVFINDSPAPLAVLRKVGDLLVDLHGQHEHQSLLRRETHLSLLDEFGRLGDLAGEFRDAWHEGNRLKTEITRLESRRERLGERRSLCDFQLKEIDAVSPEAGEEERLETELAILQNAEKLFSATDRLYRMLYEGENAVHDQLVLTRNELEDLSRIDASFTSAREEAASATAIVDELAKFIQSYNSRIEFNPERLDEIRDRLGALSLLKKKYGGSIDAVLEQRENLAAELSLADNFEAETARLAANLEESVTRVSAIAQRLSAKRRETGKKVARSIIAELASLGIANGVFETVIGNRPCAGGESLVRMGSEWYEAGESGMDDVEFFVTANLGEDPKPLVKVASGGEISRIMLAMKMILAKSDRLPLLVFDEIDAGVSGRVAQAVGRSMKKLSQFHQIIAITHLPQIAGCADIHYSVEKEQERKRTFTTMRELTLDERVREIARLMSGSEVTGAAMRSARELIDKS